MDISPKPPHVKKCGQLETLKVNSKSHTRKELNVLLPRVTHLLNDESDVSDVDSEMSFTDDEYPAGCASYADCRIPNTNMSNSGKDRKATTKTEETLENRGILLPPATNQISPVGCAFDQSGKLSNPGSINGSVSLEDKKVTDDVGSSRKSILTRLKHTLKKNSKYVNATSNLISIRPPKLQFLFNEQSSSYEPLEITVTNISDNCVTYKLKRSDNMFYVNQRMGILQPLEVHMLTCTIKKSSGKANNNKLIVRVAALQDNQLIDNTQLVKFWKQLPACEVRQLIKLSCTHHVLGEIIADQESDFSDVDTISIMTTGSFASTTSSLHGSFDQFTGTSASQGVTTTLGPAKSKSSLNSKASDEYARVEELQSNKFLNTIKTETQRNSEILVENPILKKLAAKRAEMQYDNKDSVEKTVIEEKHKVQLPGNTPAKLDIAQEQTVIHKKHNVQLPENSLAKPDISQEQTGNDKKHKVHLPENSLAKPDISQEQTVVHKKHEVQLSENTPAKPDISQEPTVIDKKHQAQQPENTTATPDFSQKQTDVNKNPKIQLQENSLAIPVISHKQTSKKHKVQLPENALAKPDISQEATVIVKKDKVQLPESTPAIPDISQKKSGIDKKHKVQLPENTPAKPDVSHKETANDKKRKVQLPKQTPVKRDIFQEQIIMDKKHEVEVPESTLAKPGTSAVLALCMKHSPSQKTEENAITHDKPATNCIADESLKSEKVTVCNRDEEPNKRETVSISRNAATTTQSVDREMNAIKNDFSWVSSEDAGEGAHEEDTNSAQDFCLEDDVNNLHLEPRNDAAHPPDKKTFVATTELLSTTSEVPHEADPAMSRAEREIEAGRMKANQAKKKQARVPRNHQPPTTDAANELKHESEPILNMQETHPDLHKLKQTYSHVESPIHDFLLSDVKLPYDCGGHTGINLPKSLPVPTDESEYESDTVISSKDSTHIYRSAWSHSPNIPTQRFIKRDGYSSSKGLNYANYIESGPESSAWPSKLTRNAPFYDFVMSHRSPKSSGNWNNTKGGTGHCPGLSHRSSRLPLSIKNPCAHTTHHLDINEDEITLTAHISTSGMQESMKHTGTTIKSPQKNTCCSDADSEAVDMLQWKLSRIKKNQDEIANLSNRVMGAVFALFIWSVLLICSLIHSFTNGLCFTLPEPEPNTFAGITRHLVLMQQFNSTIFCLKVECREITFNWIMQILTKFNIILSGYFSFYEKLCK